MIRFISGEVDSPMAKRGCALRSSRMTDRPMRRVIIASSEPENPEPIMARSKSLFIRRDSRLNKLKNNLDTRCDLEFAVYDSSVQAAWLAIENNRNHKISLHPIDRQKPESD